MRIGGYQIINFEDRNLAAGTQSVYEGIYDLIEGSRKPILITGLTISNVEQRSSFITPTLSGTSFVFAVTALDGTAYTITVADTDMVTVAAG